MNFLFPETFKTNFLVMLILTLFLRILYFGLYSRRVNKIDWLKGLKDKTFNLKYIWYDKYLFYVPFVWIWIDIICCQILVFKTNNILYWLFLIIFISSRFRALQEISHMAIHKTLCESKFLQYLAANMFFQFILFRPDAYSRRLSHMKHHFNANNPKLDPNVKDFLKIGFRPGIPNLRFIRSVLYPITFEGIIFNIRAAIRNTLFQNKNFVTLALRATTVITYTFMLCYFFNGKVLLLGYLIPVLTIYPLFLWLSQVVEHRWFVETQELDNKIRECIIGRPTDYQGLIGNMTRHLIFPFGDSYHLAHSLYPHMHWIGLKELDKKLKEYIPYYKEYSTNGLLYSNDKSRQSALLELKNRLVV